MRHPPYFPLSRDFYEGPPREVPRSRLRGAPLLEDQRGKRGTWRRESAGHLLARRTPTDRTRLGKRQRGRPGSPRSELGSLYPTLKFGEASFTKLTPEQERGVVGGRRPATTSRHRELERLYHQAKACIGETGRRAGPLAPRQARYAGDDIVHRGEVLFRDRVPGLVGPEARQRPKEADQPQ